MWLVSSFFRYMLCHVASSGLCDFWSCHFGIIAVSLFSGRWGIDWIIQLTEKIIIFMLWEWFGGCIRVTDTVSVRSTQQLLLVYQSMIYQYRKYVIAASMAKNITRKGKWNRKRQHKPEKKEFLNWRSSCNSIISRLLWLCITVFLNMIGGWTDLFFTSNSVEL